MNPTAKSFVPFAEQRLPEERTQARDGPAFGTHKDLRRYKNLYKEEQNQSQRKQNRIKDLQEQLDSANNYVQTMRLERENIREGSKKLRHKIHKQDEQLRQGKKKNEQWKKSYDLRGDDIQVLTRMIKDERKSSTDLFSQFQEERNNRQIAYDQKCTELINLSQKKEKEEMKMISLVNETKELLRTTQKTEEEWIGRSLRLKWIIDEMERVGAIRLPDHEWATDMALDIEYPENESVSIFQQTPRHIRNRYLPNYNDSHMEFADEDSESRIIENLSREAREFSVLLPERLRILYDESEQTRLIAINHITLIQAWTRGMIARRKMERCFGTSMEERAIRIDSAITIQKIFRGFRERGIRYYHVNIMEHYSRWTDYLMNSPPWMLTNDMLREQSQQRGLIFVNSGKDDYEYSWCPRSWVTDRSRHRRIRNSAYRGDIREIGDKISTYPSHWFKIQNLSKSETRYIRIQFSGVNIQIDGETKKYFDVHTGRNLTQSQFLRLDSQFWPGAPVQNESVRDPLDFPRSGNICECERCIARRRRDAQETEDEEARIQLAIQLSLEQQASQTTPTMITDDAIDYDLSFIFNESLTDYNLGTGFEQPDEPDERTILREQQDREYREAEDIDVARETLAGPVDIEAVRQARIARLIPVEIEVIAYQPRTD